MNTFLIAVVVAMIILLFFIVRSKKKAKNEVEETYVCHHCGEKDCICHKHAG